MDTWIVDVLWIFFTVLLVLANGFFVAAEFALVKVRRNKLALMVRQGRPMAKTAQWLRKRLDNALSACQLGITVASLGLGWVGEPAIARLLRPVFHAVGISSTVLQHGIAFTIAFLIITGAHLVIGEQAPKIYAIRRPEIMALWCAIPLRWFYVVSYPIIVALSWITSLLLRKMGIDSSSEHESPHSEEEIRALLSQSHRLGTLSPSEHHMLEAVFEFDDIICRKVMVPRVDVVFFDVNMTRDQMWEQIRTNMHTRYPVCDGSLDKVLGFLHVKDFFKQPADAEVDLHKLIRPPKYVPETIRISRLLGNFRETKNHLAFVVDEYSSVVGIVTMENVLERIVGSVQDEFDNETPAVVPDGPGRFLIQGSAQLDEVNGFLPFELTSSESDTMAGLIMERLERLATPGDRVELDGAVAEIIEVGNSHATHIRLLIDPEKSKGEADDRSVKRDMQKKKNKKD